MKVWLIETSSMGGKGMKKTAYSDKGTCKLKCEDYAEEWVSYTPLKAEGELIGGNRVIVSRTVYNLDKTESKDQVKSRAISKLNKEEREALGL